MTRTIHGTLVLATLIVAGCFGGSDGAGGQPAGGTTGAGSGGTGAGSGAGLGAGEGGAAGGISTAGGGGTAGAGAGTGAGGGGTTAGEGAPCVEWSECPEGTGCRQPDFAWPECSGPQPPQPCTAHDLCEPVGTLVCTFRKLGFAECAEPCDAVACLPGFECQPDGACLPDTHCTLGNACPTHMTCSTIPFFGDANGCVRNKCEMDAECGGGYCVGRDAKRNSPGTCYDEMGTCLGPPPPCDAE